MAIKRVERAKVTEYEEIPVCDRCGDESEQDDVLRETAYLGIGPITYHGRCWQTLKIGIRRGLGLWVDHKDRT